MPMRGKDRFFIKHLSSDHIRQLRPAITQVQPPFKHRLQISKVEGPPLQITHIMSQLRLLIRRQLALDKFYDRLVEFTIKADADGTTQRKGKSKMIGAIGGNDRPLPERSIRITMPVPRIVVSRLYELLGQPMDPGRSW